MTSRKPLLAPFFALAAPLVFTFPTTRALSAPFVELPGGGALAAAAAKGVALQTDDDEVSYLQVVRASHAARGRRLATQEDLALSEAAAAVHDSTAATRSVDPPPDTAAAPESAGSRHNITGSGSNPFTGSRVMPGTREWVLWQLVSGLTFWPQALVAHPYVVHVAEHWESLGKYQEVVFIPVLLVILAFARFWFFRGVVVFQLCTHISRTLTEFECNPLIWCNLGALGFGVVYVVIAILSLQHKDDERKSISNMYVSLLVLLAGLYIIVSHIAAFLHYRQYSTLLSFMNPPDAFPATH